MTAAPWHLVNLAADPTVRGREVTLLLSTRGAKGLPGALESCLITQ